MIDSKDTNIIKASLEQALASPLSIRDQAEAVGIAEPERFKRFIARSVCTVERTRLRTDESFNSKQSPFPSKSDVRCKDRGPFNKYAESSKPSRWDSAVTEAGRG